MVTGEQVHDVNERARGMMVNMVTIRGSQWFTMMFHTAYSAWSMMVSGQDDG